ncbi:MAG TPA: magnesium-protoporphyrin IX monomethyl ester anaerobic oxidative cyclase [Sedimentisphaerales bacterium]|jgi:anaerobic magnesium-protoporphyrin IX monomethyl ester cyclase|nr:magnesium-protoporphyrin IX monomethyl ester anaerobic oxidative cyclase [Sedimentisphaerales bacterium]HNU27674.1 magnesium-protoporphyrin IX monomethyl ester anaerobic oxidative cyclase [Sedimentisphaerales bacterium]
MRILLVNPPHPSIGSRIPHEHLPPLGLLSIGGPLIDAGHELRLLDAEFGPLSTREIVEQVVTFAPQVVLLGHSGSTSGHPIAAMVARAIHEAIPAAWIVYGGVFPTFHWRRILADEPQFDVIVRGEGEETILRVIDAIETDVPLEEVPGIAYREAGLPRATAPARILDDLDAFRVGWQLIDPSRYTYWGDRRAVVVQFSRGCPHQCNYCGQHPFWRRWRHRDPQKLAAELAWLHRTHGVEVIDFADENPNASRPAWRAFLEALITENVPLTLVGSTRADDIVRDADILHLYKQAGFARLLLGIESYNEETLRKIRKGGTTAKDREAIRLLRRHNILSMATYVVGFDDETDRDYWRGLRQLVSYDPDQIQMLYATPHHWTPYFHMASDRRVVQTDLSKWDYKHQVLASRHMSPWRVLIWVKFIEAVMQFRPRSLRRLFAHPDLPIRDAMKWYYRIGRQVWPYEIRQFLFHDHCRQDGPTLAEFWGPTEEAGELGSAEQIVSQCLQD